MEVKNATKKSPKNAERRTMIRKLKAAVEVLASVPNRSVSFVVARTAPVKTIIFPKRISALRYLAIIFIIIAFEKF
jgi:hypothetical protein